MSALGAPQLRRAFGALGGREARAVEGGTQRWRRPLRSAVGGAFAGAVILGAVLGYTNSSPDSLHASPTGGSVDTYSGERNMNITKSLAAIASTSAAQALALSAAFICESASAQQAVQWRVEDGGNGHWYSWIDTTVTLNAATQEQYASARGGHLWTVRSSDEGEFLSGHVPPDSCILGGIRVQGAWHWTTAETWDYANWCPGQPDSSLEHRASYMSVTDGCMTSGSLRFGNVEEPWPHMHYVAIEWSADCNSDGIVDYGQILAGELDDANANNIPDCCEQATSCNPCPADVIENGVVDSIDLSAVLSTWGTDGGAYPRADINHDGIVAAEDLGSVLAGWGTCP